MAEEGDETKMGGAITCTTNRAFRVCNCRHTLQFGLEEMALQWLVALHWSVIKSIRHARADVS
jgi:hypothetical protein